MILSETLTTKALTSLCGCTGWSAHLLFANTEDRFSRVEVHMVHIPNGIEIEGLNVFP